MTKAYAGIGSRETPADILLLMRDLAAALAIQGWTLRSGSAPGADTAFELGSDLRGGLKEIFLPWKGFQGRALVGGVQLLAPEILPAAEEIAGKAHPRWQYLKRGPKALHTRNVAQILGPRLEEPVRFVLCWTKGGTGAGGTGQAIRIAQNLGIQVFDLGQTDVLARVRAWLEGDCAKQMV